MVRIIRVSGCHDCWHCKSSFMVNDFYCKKIKMSVDKYVETKTLPDNCPLEKIPKTGFGASFDFLDDEGEDIYEKEEK